MLPWPRYGSHLHLNEKSNIYSVNTCSTKDVLPGVRKNDTHFSYRIYQVQDYRHECNLYNYTENISTHAGKRKRKIMKVYWIIAFKLHAPIFQYAKLHVLAFAQNKDTISNVGYFKSFLSTQILLKYYIKTRYLKYKKCSSNNRTILEKNH